MKQSVLALLLLAGCTVETIVAAHDPAAGEQGDGDGDESSDGCKTSADCAGNEFCEKASCRAPSGHCTRKDLACGGEFAASCGCDGLHYLNDCLRRAHGVNAADEASCHGAHRCGGASDPACPSDTFCGKLGVGPEECSPLGECWVLPAQCPSENPNGGDLFSTCEQGAEMMCMPICEAIRSEQPLHHIGICRLPGGPGRNLGGQ
jgi:hypothetical protein